MNTTGHEKIKEMSQLRDITRIKASTNVLPVVHGTYHDDDGSYMIPDDFTTWKHIEKQGGGTDIGFDDNHE